MVAQASRPSAPVRVGCPGWVYKHWRGLFYRETLAVKNWFAGYAGTFDTVEIDNSVYRPEPLSVHGRESRRGSICAR